MENEINNNVQPEVSQEPVVQPAPVEQVNVQPEPIPVPVPTEQPEVGQEPAVQPVPAEQVSVPTEGVVTQPEQVEIPPEEQTIVQEAPAATEATLAPEIKPEELEDVANVTFDYNSLYGIDPSQASNDAAEDNGPQLVFQAEENLDVNATTLVGRESSVTPEFNMNVLTGEEQTNNNLTDKVLDAKQQDKADTRKKLLYIGVITILIIVFIKFIFPLFV